jgi:chemotaxis protein methyltransferase CheR
VTPIESIAALIHQETGIKIGKSQHGSLETALSRVLPAVGPEQFLRQALDPVAGRAVVSRLIDEVTVKETYFLREREQLRSIPWRALLDRARESGSPEIRVWSAGCATGEEAYTLALLASEEFGVEAPPVSILATDVSAAAVEDARAGVYRPRSVRDLDPTLRRRYFEEDGDRLLVGARLRSLVTFAQHNLLRDPTPPLGAPTFHLVLCRNVLIYFDGETVERVIASLGGALDPSGLLLLGAADALCESATAARRGVKREQPAAAPKRPRRKPLRAAPLKPANDPPDEVAHYLEGLAALEGGEFAAAVESLRRALYLEPHFSLAAFKLGRAHEALSNWAAARRSYQRAIRAATHAQERYEQLYGPLVPGDVVHAAETRLEALASVGA